MPDVLFFDELDVSAALVRTLEGFSGGCLAPPDAFTRRLSAAFVCGLGGYWGACVVVLLPVVDCCSVPVFVTALDEYGGECLTASMLRSSAGFVRPLGKSSGCRLVVLAAFVCCTFSLFARGCGGYFDGYLVLLTVFV